MSNSEATGNGSYNGLGIFSGTAQPVNLQGEVDGTLLMFYTSVSYLPTAWSLPYHPYTETQSFAMSTDGGQTFEFSPDHPVIDTTTNIAPMYWNLTGFRDPFFLPIPELDDILGVSEPHYYVVFGSGIKGVGPRIPLWTAPSSDLTDWTFLGALWEPAMNTSLGPLLSTRTYGFNFEVSGFFALPDSSGSPHFFVNMGAEGGNLSYAESQHTSLWNEGAMSRRDNGSAEFTPIAGGLGDWGNLYVCPWPCGQFSFLHRMSLANGFVVGMRLQASTTPRTIAVSRLAGLLRTSLEMMAFSAYTNKDIKEAILCSASCSSMRPLTLPM